MFTMQSFRPRRISAGVFSNLKKILVEDELVVTGKHLASARDKQLIRQNISPNVQVSFLL